MAIQKLRLGVLKGAFKAKVSKPINPDDIGEQQQVNPAYKRVKIRGANILARGKLR